MYVLVDTCVFLDILFKREHLYENSKQLFLKLKENKSRIFISPTTLKDIFYFSCKELHNKEQAYQIINSIYSIAYKIIDITADDAINAMFSYGDFEDNLLIEAAQRTLLDCVITRNIKDYINKDINVFTPEEILGMLN